MRPAQVDEDKRERERDRWCRPAGSAWFDPPAITDPAVTDQVITDPIITDLVITDPVITDARLR